jgi:hypothetical protein
VSLETSSHITSPLDAVVGSTLVLVSTVLIGGERRSERVIYISNDSAVATVGQNTVTTIGVGTVTITAILSATDEYISSSATFSITVLSLYEVNSAGVITSYRGASNHPNLVIPDTIGGTIITGIDGNVFKNSTDLISIILPSSLTSISSYAFYGCTSLTSINLSSVTSIGASAFVGCTSLTSVTLPSILTSISIYAFYGCTSLTSIKLPSKLTSIGANAFGGCQQLTSITILGKANTLYTNIPTRTQFWDTNPRAHTFQDQSLGFSQRLV